MAYRDILRQRARKNTQCNRVFSHGIASIIKKFVVTEKGFNAEIKTDSNPVYVFYVDMAASKNDIKYVVESVYNVSVQAVKTLIMPQKCRTNRWIVRKSLKKAYVTLLAWQEISFAS